MHTSDLWPGDSLHVVEIGSGIPAAFGARLLADFGADVIKVENAAAPDVTRAIGPFRGDVPDPEASGLFVYLNHNKRGVSLDFTSAHDVARLRQLIATADIVIEDLGAGVFRQLVGADPWPESLVVCSISAYGQSGPKAHYLGSELSAYASGGLLYMTGDQAAAPVKHGYNQASYLAGVNAASASLAAAIGVKRTGVGQRIDISMQETVALTTFPALTVYSHTGGVIQRAPLDLPRLATSQAMRASDGWIMPSDAGLNVWWESFAAFVDCPELLAPPFLDRATRALHEGELDDIVGPAFASRTRAALFHDGQEQGLTMSAVQSSDEVAACPHLAARNFFIDVPLATGGSLRMPGPAPALLGLETTRQPRPAPALGQDNERVFEAPPSPDEAHPVSPAANPSRRLPLEGVRILELGMVFVLPLAVTPLAALGADVIKVESASRPDSVRSGPMPANEPRDDGYNAGGNFHLLNRNKRGITLDLATPAGRQLLLDLVAKSDIVAENFTPRVLKNLGLSYEQLREVNPRIILLSSTGFGQTGPWQNYKAYGPTTESVDGLMHLTGYPDGPPVRGGAGGFGVAFTDVAGAYFGTYAMLAALERRERTGEGIWLDLSHYEAGVATLPEPILDYFMNGRVAMRDGNRDPRRAPQGVYPCKDPGEWIAISVETDPQWQSLVAVLGLEAADSAAYEDFESRRQAQDLLDARIAARTATWRSHELEAELQAASVEAAHVASPKDLWLDPQLISRGFGRALAEPPYLPGVGERVYPRPAWLTDSVAAQPDAPAPAFGQHTREVLRELLGLTNAAIDALADDGVIADAPRAGLISSRKLDLEGLLASQRLIEVDAAHATRLLEAYRRE